MTKPEGAAGEKEQLLKELRTCADNYRMHNDYASLTNCREKAKYLNKKLDEKYDDMSTAIAEEDIPPASKINRLLLVEYLFDIVKLEERNSEWKYDYMSFSRRIGEMWERFCKIPFIYPTNDLTIIEPQNCVKVFQSIQNEFEQLINKSKISENDAESIREHYHKIWKIIQSGSIDLKLDIHFSQDNIFYNVDLKSGFGSNEKGNVNRLLIVGSIYRIYSEIVHNVQSNEIYVRESDNNNYLKKLQESEYWQVYCGRNAYERMFEITGYDIKAWIDGNISWREDMSTDFLEYLDSNSLYKYLEW